MLKVLTYAADGPRIGLDGLRLQAFEFQVLEMQVVIIFEFFCGGCFHFEVASWFVVKQSLVRGREATF